MRKGITEQTGCHNCVYVLRVAEYDEGYSYFCAYKEQAPISESALRGDWNKWKSKEIQPWCICKYWKL